MNSGYYAACAGLMAQTQALELASNNLANVNTSGYLRQQESFDAVLARAQGHVLTDPLQRAINNFGVLGSTRLDLGQGSLQRTGNPLDLAVEGPGFFAVQTANGVRYTRSGNFQVSAQGQLVTLDNRLVLGEQGPLPVPSGELAVSGDGTLSVNGALVGKLKLVEFAPGTPLVAEGTSFYAAPEGAVQTAKGTRVSQGALVSSNVNPVLAAVNLIAIQRQAGMLERALASFHAEFNRIAAQELPRV